MTKKTTPTGSSQAVLDMDQLPLRFRPHFEREPDGRWLAVIEKYSGIMAYGETKNEAAGHAIELLLRFLDERASFADYLASIPVEDEELKPEFAQELERRQHSEEPGIPHDDILREFGLKK